MASSPKVTVTLDANAKPLQRGFDQAEKGAHKWASGIGKIGSMAALGLAGVATAAAVAAVDFGKQAIDAAKADDAAAKKLAKTLQNVTGATKAQTAAVEDYITKTELATGVSDDQLRPSLDRLVRSTHDVTEAQKLQALALDISAGTGKDLAAVSEALGKAHDGNMGALKRLGIPLDANIIKSKDFGKATEALAATFSGQAATAADTFEGKTKRIGIAFDEAKETVGGFLMDALAPVLDYVAKGAPKLLDMAGKLGTYLNPAFKYLADIVQRRVIPAVTTIFNFFRTYVIPMWQNILTPIINGLRTAFEKVAAKIDANSEKLKPLLKLFYAVWGFIRDKLAPVIGTILGKALEFMGNYLATAIDLISSLVDWFDKVIRRVGEFTSAIANSPVGQFVGNVVSNLFGGGRANGGPVLAGTSYLVGERGPEIFTPGRSGMITPNGGGNITVNINGTLLDPEGAARAIRKVLRESTLRTGAA